MSTAEHRRLTPAEYLAIEAASEIRHEFHDGEMFAMSGGSYWHNLVKDNFARALGNRLAARGCTVLTSDQRVKVDATGLYTYPDVVVFCGKPTFEDDIHYSATNPLLLAEVLSDSTEKYDRGVKFGHYRQLPSVEEYVVLAQDRVSIERYRRQRPGQAQISGPGRAESSGPGRAEAWILTAVTDPEGTIDFESLGISVPVAEVYAGVEFSSPSRRP